MNMTGPLTFDIAATDGLARTGTIRMARGEIRTPAFMPVGTAGTVKGMKPADVRAIGADIILGNTYHLMLRPGAERLARLGGLHGWMRWDRPILTDSGGYQVMSLGDLTTKSEEGVAFKSHLDGSRHMLSPERSMEIQTAIGADIVMAFDECTPYPAGQAEMFRVLDFAVPMLPADKPHYLMGVGKPDDIVGAVERGIDMFDCVLPTRSGRNGQAFTWDGPINIRNAKFAEDMTPLDPQSPVAAWSKSYLHHLVRSGEMLGAMLMTEHNLWFYQQVMAGLRAAIAAGSLAQWAAAFRARYAKQRAVP